MIGVKPRSKNSKENLIRFLFKKFFFKANIQKPSMLCSTDKYNTLVFLVLQWGYYN